MKPETATLIANLAVYVGAALAVAAAVVYFDWRAGLAVLSLLLLAGGLNQLKEKRG